MSEKKLLFLSHATIERELAIALKAQIDGALLGAFDVFVSSDPGSLKVGSEWIKEVHKALRHCNAMVVLCSEESVLRPWLNFETGVGWAREIPVIPLCHSGLTLAGLPQTLSSFQAIGSLAPNSLKVLYESLAETFGLKCPPADFELFSQNLSEYEVAGFLDRILTEIGTRCPLIETGLRSVDAMGTSTIESVPRNEYETVLTQLNELREMGFLDFRFAETSMMASFSSTDEEKEAERNKPLGQTQGWFTGQLRFEPSSKLLTELRRIDRESNHVPS